jgi:GT2 family glycosyltransferase
MAKLSVIIPAYRASTLLKEVVASVARSNYPDQEVIIVDNGLSPGIIDIVRAAASGFSLRFVGSGINLGVSAARNLGAKNASGQVLLFLDHDVLLGPGSVERLVDAVLSDRTLAVAGPLIRYAEDPSKIWWSGGTVLLPSGRVKMLNDDPGEWIRYTDSIPSVLTVRRDVYDKLGGFDEKFFVGFEDADFCFRTINLGYRCACICSAEAYHFIPLNRVEAEKRLLARSYITFKNRYLFIKKHCRSRLCRLSYLLFYNPAFLVYYTYKALIRGDLRSIWDMIKGSYEGCLTSI